MSRDWTFYLEDIHASARKVAQYTKGLTREKFHGNGLVCDAVIRNLEIIGEAAKHLPTEATAAMPDVEWTKAAAFRDVIAHHYFGLDLNVVWDVVRNKIPAIEAATTDLLAKQRNRSDESET